MTVMAGAVLGNVYLRVIQHQLHVYGTVPKRVQQDGLAELGRKASEEGTLGLEVTLKPIIRGRDGSWPR